MLDKLGGGGRKGFAGANRLKGDKKRGCLSGSHARSHNTPAEDVIARLSGGLGHKVEGCNEGLCALSGPRLHKNVPPQPLVRPVSFEIVWCGMFHVTCACVSLDLVAFSMRGAQCACFVQTWMSKRAHAHQRMRILCFVPSLFYSDFQNLDEPCFTAFLRRTSRRSLQDTVPDP